MTDKNKQWIWFINKENPKRINLGNSAQEFFATEKLALKNKTRLYWKERNK